MYGVVRPVAESILPKATLRRQGRGPVTGYATRAAHAAYASRSTHTTDAADATYSTGPAHSADTADATYSTGPAHSADTADATYSTGPAHSADAADTTYSTGPTDTTDAADATYSTGPTDTTDAAGDVVAIEAVVMVDINTATAPAATPAPTAAPPCSHQHSRAEGERGAGHVVAGRIVDRRIRIRRRTVYGCRLISRHVDNFRICRLYHDHALVFNYFRSHCLLLSGVQSALVLRLPAHALDGIHQFALLRQEGVAEIGSPRDVVSQEFHDFR